VRHFRDTLYKAAHLKLIAQPTPMLETFVIKSTLEMLASELHWQLSNEIKKKNYKGIYFIKL
jgi:hypothetical protein